MGNRKRHRDREAGGARSVRIIAIDPGNAFSAFCVLEGDIIAGFGKEANSDVLTRVRREWSPFDSKDLLVIEMIASYGMAVGREVFETCLWIGRYIEAWERRQGDHRLVYRRDVKLFHCHSARATDANIRAALLDRYGPGREIAVGTKRARGPLHGLKGDCWAALALALTVHGNKADLLGRARAAARRSDVPYLLHTHSIPGMECTSD
jgi:hypothetical protein